MKRFLRLLGSIKIAVPLLIAIAIVLAWGTLYETRFGTAAVQRVVYRAWWFQALLGFLAINLAIAAWQRYPWKRQHAPFVLAHLGIILILVGGILGGRFGVEGQLIIPEGGIERVMDLPVSVLSVHVPDAEQHVVIPTRFESQAWVQEPKVRFPMRLAGRNIELTVNRYYPDAVTEELITGDGQEENPAVRVVVAHAEHEEQFWLFARDSERFGMGWGEAHILLLEPQTPQQLAQLLGERHSEPTRGSLSIKLPGMDDATVIPVPDRSETAVAVEGTPYRITFKDYFPDFTITSQGVESRSQQPNNPAVSFTLTGPEGTDAYLLFGRYPEFQSMHGITHVIPAEVRYTHLGVAALPPNGIALIRKPSGSLVAALTDAQGAREELIDPLKVGTPYTHPSMGYTFTVAEYYPKARVEPQVTNRSSSVKMEALHLTVREGEATDEAWVGMRGSVRLSPGGRPLIVEYRPDRRTLPVTVKLLDFRKIDYPGIQMAAGFESDVELSDPKRGLLLMRTIKMNTPLRYRGYSFYQSSFIDGPKQTTVLSVRNDPGTPFVYAGFLIVIGGVMSLFISRRASTRQAAGRARKRTVKGRRP